MPPDCSEGIVCVVTESRLHHLVPVTRVAGVPALPVFVVGAIVPVVAVAEFTVAPVVVVAAAPVPVVAPPWIPPLAGAPVIIRERCGLGLGDGCRPQTREP
jgi:hypothetical protein